MFDYIFKANKKPGEDNQKGYGQLECLECLKLTNKMFEQELLNQVDYSNHTSSQQ